MGNVHSDVTSNVKAQADAQDSETYKLIDVKGGGELMKLMKDPVLRRNTAKLDEEIYKRVIDCLYNEGRGEDVTLNNFNFKFYIYISFYVRSQFNKLFLTVRQINLKIAYHRRLLI